MGDHAQEQGGLTPEEIEAGRLLFAQECRFVAGAANEAALPPDTLPEVAFAGRSNVGKSSLVNALTGRTTLARTSHTPGRTQQLNFFDLGGRLMLVDMPGYGYAEAPKNEVARWTRLVRDYLKGRVSLRRTLLLVDARHGLKEIDRPWLQMFDEAAVSYQVVLTKSDKVKPVDLARGLEKLGRELARHVAAHPEVAVTSAHEGRGIAELRAALAALAAP
ncbi:MAG: YihA family ribosome biogenesis GTP-binding protein [Rhodospirillales bacterium]|nr:YihA family ribosome biogenesis GTP-binding protein [Rhodospirillales bacterium]